MRARLKDTAALTDEQRTRLGALLVVVPDDAGEGDPALLAMLNFWEGAHVAYGFWPTVPAYHTQGGHWIFPTSNGGGVGRVLRALAAYAAGEARLLEKR